MNRGMMVGLGVLTVLVAGIAAYALLHPSPAKGPGGAAPEGTLGSYSEHAAYYDVAASYPTTTPLAASASDAAITTMQGFVINTISQFKTDGNFDQGRKESLQITYTTVSSPHTASYIFTTYADTGGAHGNTMFRTFTFDTNPSTSSGQAGAPLTLADLFVPGAKYLDTLSTIARAKLPAIIGPDADARMMSAGTAPEIQNFENFSLDNATLDILFAPYAVAAYAAGAQTLPIPLTDLASILRRAYQ